MITIYEYRLCPVDKCIIQVRPKHTKQGHPHAWRDYMTRETEADAARVMAMLEHPEGESVVRE